MTNQKCQIIKKKIDKFISLNPKKICADEHESDHRIFGLENICNITKKFSKDGFIINIGTLLLKKKLQTLMTMGNKLVYKRKNLGSGGGWHKDAFCRQFKAILYLSDVKYNNGPFQIIKNSNKVSSDFKLFFKFEKNLRNSRISNKEANYFLKNRNYKLETICGKAGTLILVDASNIHRGMPIKKGKRFAITSYIYPKEKIKNYTGHFKPRIYKNTKFKI